MMKNNKRRSREQELIRVPASAEEKRRRGPNQHPNPKFLLTPHNRFKRVGVVLQSQQGSDEERDNALRTLKGYLETYDAELLLMLQNDNEPYLYTIISSDKDAKGRLRNQTTREKRGKLKKTMTAPIDPRCSFCKKHLEQNTTRLPFSSFIQGLGKITDHYLYIYRDGPVPLYVDAIPNIV